jgi:hypothetical protein
MLFVSVPVISITNRANLRTVLLRIYCTVLEHGG